MWDLSRELFRRYRVHRRAEAIGWRDVALLAGLANGVGVVLLLDVYMPPPLSRDVLYLVPIAAMAWLLAPPAALFYALIAGVTRAALAEARMRGADAVAAAPLDWIAIVNTATTVAQFLAVVWLLLRLRALVERERRRAVEDALTGLLNRRGFHDALDRTLSTGRRRRSAARAGALVYVDLDGFKAVNDTFGHEAGDAVLRLAATAIGAHAGARGTAARLGGDEFAVWLHGDAAADAERVADALLAGIRAAAAEAGWAVGASIGVAIFAAPPASAVAALAAADALMYEAKRGGKGRVRLAAA